jgi:hypothetical protein
MLLAHDFPLATTDIDAVPAAGVTVDELDPLIKEVARELSLPLDWLNPFFSTFTHVLPTDYGQRLIEVASFRCLKVSALSREDLFIMKCFAARQKDVIHARALFKKGLDLALVKKHIHFLEEKRIPGCEKAIKFLNGIESFFIEREE